MAFSRYDIIIDATDNVPSRYMINDCCAVLKKVMKGLNILEFLQWLKMQPILGTYVALGYASKSLTPLFYVKY